MRLLDALDGILGPGGLATGEELAAALEDPITRTRGTAVALAKPRSTDEVSAVVRACAEAGARIVPRGGGSGFVAGAIPRQDGENVILSLARMNRIRSVDTADETMTVEAGVVLAAAREAAAEHDLLLPVAHGGEGSAQIGGTIATNAGGHNVLKYGMTRAHVLGLEAVLADGTVWDGLRPLRKDNAGFDLKQLFIGTEGTLGIVTAATLRLSPAPRADVTALAAVTDPAAALALFQALRRRLGDLIAAFELMPRAALALHFERHPEARDPFDTPHGWVVLVELASPAEGLDLDSLVEGALGAALEAQTVRDVIIARSGRERDALWSLREGLAEAQAVSPRVLKSDTAVPVSRTPEFIAAATRAVAEVIPGATPLPFGHIGDGNIHFNVLAPEAMTTADFLAERPRLISAIDAATIALGGTIAAEHGIGSVKRTALAALRSHEDQALARALKHALDPAGRLNPGKVLPDHPAA
ncbi:MAG: FAD-binding oxidoreductase [Pseudomonadota bacterium]